MLSRCESAVLLDSPPDGGLPRQLCLLPEHDPVREYISWQSGSLPSLSSCALCYPEWRVERNSLSHALSPARAGPDLDNDRTPLAHAKVKLQPRAPEPGD